ncbi:hypothetical protein GKZ68_20460 (plasmid) [Hymenobacter sp. BRD128]|uniref:hypothetical protein n=1 Tax=Hymenobacter sp. BRD128 TaxID=2675878 RepID=UPI0015635320|nr:hypothetical protein [Hymenobacter sp. BRD128]QKG59057.1 hypothetical protein GKZ68_20460 [Hymenobacter sp. BRD128]
MNTLLLDSGSGLLTSTAFQTALHNSTVQMVTICQNYITPIALVIAMLTSIGRGYLTGASLRMDLSPIIRGVAIWVALAYYMEWVQLPYQGVEGIISAMHTASGGATGVGSALYQTLHTSGWQSATPAPGQVGTANQMIDNNPSFFSQAWDMIQNFNIMSLITRFVTNATIELVRLVFLFVRQFVLGFIIMAGPFAMSLGIIPAFSQLFKHWLQNYFSVLLWGVTFSMLDMLYSYWSQSQNLGSGGSVGAAVTEAIGVQQLVYTVSFLVLYCMVPYLTSLVIGGSATQGFFGAFAGVATGAATAAAGVATGQPGGFAQAVGRAVNSSASGSTGGGSGAAAPAAAAAAAAPPAASSGSDAAGLPALAAPVPSAALSVN